MMLSSKLGTNEKFRNEVNSQRTNSQKNLQMKDKNTEAVIPKEIKEKNQDTFSLSHDMKQFKEELEKQLKSSENQKDAFMDLAKVMEIARRIARGDMVPPKDEKKVLK